MSFTTKIERVALQSAVFAIFLFIVVFGSAAPVHAATTYETAAALSSNVVDFPIVASGSGATSTPNYQFWYRLPLGVEFDRIQFSVPTAQGTYSSLLQVWLGTLSGTMPWACMNSNCASGSQVVDLRTSNDTKVASDVLEFQLPTSTVVTTHRDLYVGFDPSGADFLYNGTSNQPESAALNGYNYTRSLVVPTIKLCNGTCDNNSFSPVPNLTASPWGRLISPPTGSIVQAGTVASLQFQANTGTTTADNVQVRFVSTIQSLVPYDYTITSTGLNSFSYDLNLPAVDDYLQIVVDVRSGTTSLYVSPTYTLDVRTDASGAGVNPVEVATCDDQSGLAWAICSTVAFLFVPSESSVDKFTSLKDTMESKLPFVYLYQVNDLVDTLYNSPQLASSSVTVSILGGNMTLLSVAQLQAVGYTAWLRTIIGYIMWVLFAALMYRKALKVFNKPVQ